MIHQPLGGFQGQASDFEIHAKEILSMKKKLNEILAFHTGKEVDQLEKDTERDNFNCEINNLETFEKLLDILKVNTINFDLYF